MSNNISYILFKRSALQFTEDLREMSKQLESLDEQKIMATSSYIAEIKREIQFIEDRFVQKV